VQNLVVCLFSNSNRYIADYQVVMSSTEHGKATPTMLQVVGMLPNIISQDGDASLVLVLVQIHEVVVLVGSGLNHKLVLAAVQQPGPTACPMHCTVSLV
jgi:hypothetical protein